MRNLLYVITALMALLVIQNLLPKFISEVSSEPPEQMSIDDEYVHTLKAVHLVESFKDDKEWELFSESARNSESTASWLLSRVKVNFLDQEGRLTHVLGDEATFHSKDRKLHIFGNVSVETQNGYVIKTKEIFYTSKDRQLFTLNEVEILRKEFGDALNKPQSTIKGGYMRTSMRDQEMLLGDTVKAARYLGGGRRLIVRSGEAKLSRNQGSVEFYESVNIVWGANEFSGDRAQFLYQEKENQLETVILTESVRIQADNRYASCEKAILDIQNGTTELLGNPRVVQSDNQITGDIILLNHEDDTVQVKNIRANFQESR